MKEFWTTFGAVLAFMVLVWLMYKNYEREKAGKWERGHHYIHIGGNRDWTHDPDCRCRQ